MPRRENWEPDLDGTIPVMLDCGRCVVPVDQKEFIQFRFDSKCKKHPNRKVN